MSNTPRGIRNHNPGNLKRGTGHPPWMGLEAEQKDPHFLQFQEAVYGIRAMYKVLLSYRKLYKLDTIEEIVNRWAPGCVCSFCKGVGCSMCNNTGRENDPEAYIKSLCEETGFERDEEINIFDRKVGLKLLRAIIRHENGVMPYSDEILNKAMELAL